MARTIAAQASAACHRHLGTCVAGPRAANRFRLAVKRFRENKAPLILVSGGFVHPAQTPCCEAIEMKKMLMASFGLSDDSILVDPFARHTTTNIRNAVREIYRYGIPFGKRALIVTDSHQSLNIQDPKFGSRCLSELRYCPYQSLTRLSPDDLAFVPNIESLQADSMDPLDP